MAVRWSRLLFSELLRPGRRRAGFCLFEDVEGGALAEVKHLSGGEAHNYVFCHDDFTVSTDVGPHGANRCVPSRCQQMCALAVSTDVGPH